MNLLRGYEDVKYAAEFLVGVLLAHTLVESCDPRESHDPAHPARQAENDFSTRPNDKCIERRRSDGSKSFVHHAYVKHLTKSNCAVATPFR